MKSASKTPSGIRKLQGPGGGNFAATLPWGCYPARNIGPAIRVIRVKLTILVRNQTRNTVLADRAEVADTSAKRNTGLLKHERLDPGQGLWIVPCSAVHSFWMKFAIDLVYLDRKKRVRKVKHRMVPWRMSGCIPAHSVLELPVGAIESSKTEAGDQLTFEELS